MLAMALSGERDYAALSPPADTPTELAGKQLSSRATIVARGGGHATARSKR